MTATPPASPAWVSIYRCKSWQGASFWASTPCGEHRASIDRIHRVPGTLPWPQQVAIAQAEAEEAAKLYAPPVTVRANPAPDADPGRATRSGECAALDQMILNYDAITRQPKPAWVMDDVRVQRRRAMDRKFALKC